MSRLAKQNRVIFVNPQVDFFEYLKRQKYNVFKLLDRRERPPDEALEVFTPLAVPFRDRFDFVHKIDPLYFVRQIKKVLGDAKTDDLILFLGNPWNVFLLDFFKDCACSIYHCSDNFPAFFEGSFRAKVAERETEMMTGADIVIASSELLFEKNLKFNPRSYLIKHGVDENFFIKSEDKPPEPEDLRTIKRPRIGFVGSIDRTIDFELLEYIINEHKDKSFVFIGPVDKDCMQNFNRLTIYQNLYHFGEKMWTELPGYVKRFDICLIPWVSNEFVKSRCPLKLIEYLAAGRSVVSTFPVNDNLSSAVKVAQNKEEFSDLIVLAITQSREPHSAKNISSLVKDQSWDNKVGEISGLIEHCISTRT